MTDEIGVYAAKTHLTALLDRVEHGEQFTITRHGRAIARLIPVKRSDQERRREAIARLLVFRKGRTLGVPIKQLIEEGRR
jgi:prevent-host-death family protein